jgi:predicted nucleic acid-binding protein
VLLIARRQRLLTRVKPELDQLRANARFYIAQPLYESVLRQAGELP